MVGKAERGSEAIEAIKDNKAVYLMAVGGSAYLVSKAIVGSKVVGFADLGMEAIYELNANPAPLLENSGYTRRIPTGGRPRSFHG